MTIKDEEDLLDSLEREIEEFHELRKRCRRLSLQGLWPMLEAPLGADVEAPAADRSSSPA